MPAVGEAPPASAAPAGRRADGKVNLNTADEPTLETLPRVGPAMAQRIIDWRDRERPVHRGRRPAERLRHRREDLRGPPRPGDGVTIARRRARLADLRLLPRRPRSALARRRGRRVGAPAAGVDARGGRRLCWVRRRRSLAVARTCPVALARAGGPRARRGRAGGHLGRRRTRRRRCAGGARRGRARRARRSSSSIDGDRARGRRSGAGHRARRRGWPGRRRARDAGAACSAIAGDDAHPARADRRACCASPARCGAPSRARTSAFLVFAARRAPSAPAPPPPLLAAADARAARLPARGTGLPGDGGALLPGLAIGDTSSVSADARRRDEDVEPQPPDGGLRSELRRRRRAGARRSARRSGSAAARAGRGRGASVLAGFVVLVTPEPSVVRAAVMAAVALVALATGRAGARAPAALRRGHRAARRRSVAGAQLRLRALGARDGRAAAARAAARRGARRGGCRAGSRWCSRCRSRRSSPASRCCCCSNPSLPLYGVAANLLAEPAAAPVDRARAGRVPGRRRCCRRSATVARLARLGARELDRGGRDLLRRASRARAAPWPTGALGVVLLIGADGRGAGRRARRRAAAGAAGRSRGAGRRLRRLPRRPSPARSWSTSVARPADWEFALCDVGQGDATVIRSGGDDRARSTPARSPRGSPHCLDELGITRIDLLVLTHYDLDHVGGVVGGRRQVDRVLIGPPSDPGDVRDRLRPARGRRRGRPGEPGRDRGARASCAGTCCGRRRAASSRATRRASRSRSTGPARACRDASAASCSATSARSRRRGCSAPAQLASRRRRQGRAPRLRRSVGAALRGAARDGRADRGRRRQRLRASDREAARHPRGGRHAAAAHRPRRARSSSRRAIGRARSGSGPRSARTWCATASDRRRHGDVDADADAGVDAPVGGRG